MSPLGIILANPERRRLLFAALATGSVDEACRLAGVDRDDFALWWARGGADLKRGRETVYASFTRELGDVFASRVEHLLSVIAKNQGTERT